MLRLLTHPVFQTFEKVHPMLASKKFFFLTLFTFKIALFTHLLFCADMAGTRNKFTEVARPARKDKAVAATTDPPLKQVRRAEEIIMLSTPPPSPAIEGIISIQPKSSSRDTPLAAPAQTDVPQEEAGVGAICLEASSTWRWL